MKCEILLFYVLRIHIHIHIHMHTPVLSDVDECAVHDNGGCDSKRTCTNLAGSMQCEDCPSPSWANDGAKGCKGWCWLVN